MAVFLAWAGCLSERMLADARWRIRVASGCAVALFATAAFLAWVGCLFERLRVRLGSGCAVAG
jgi:hypothetical protein